MAAKVELQVGQEVWIKTIRRGVRPDIETTKGRITKMGRKYFFVVRGGLSDEYASKFLLDTMMDDDHFNAERKIYLSEQEILDEQEVGKLEREIQQVFDMFSRVKLSLDQLRRIKQILDEGKEDE